MNKVKKIILGTSLIALLVLIVISKKRIVRFFKAPVVVIQDNDLLRASDPNNGAKLVLACMGCHNFQKGEPHKAGPTLFGIVGAEVGVQEGFEYSGAFIKLREEGRIWTTDELYNFIRAPEVYAPGTKMHFVGFLDPQDRMDVISYLIKLK